MHILRAPISDSIYQRLQNRFKILWRIDGSATSGMQMPKIDGGNHPVIQPNQLDNLLQISQLIYLAHRFGAIGKISMPSFIQLL